MTALDFDKVWFRAEISADTDFLLKLYISTRELELKQLDWSHAEKISFLTQQFKAQYASYRQVYPDAEFDLIEYQAESIGRLYLLKSEAECRLIDIALLPEYRNRKLGQHLIQNIQHLAAKTSSPVTLHVDHANPAFSLYKRLGFEIVEDKGVHLFMRWHPDNPGV